MSARYWIIGLLLFACSQGYAQSKAELEAQRKALIADIKYTNSLISESREAQKFTQSELSILQKQIDLRAQLIRSLRKEKSALDKTIKDTQTAIIEKEQELERLKNEYAQLVYLAFKTSNSYDEMLYIFAADDFYQAWMRMRHLKDIARFRQRQADAIVEAKALLAEKKTELDAQREEKELLIADQKLAQAQLDKDRKIKQESLEALKANEEELLAKAQEQEDKQRALSKKIEELIAADIERNKQKSGKTEFELTPEEALSSGYFSKNKGKLPWPVNKGVIISSFGTHAHPVLRGITVTNNGIDISTEANAMVRSVFEGEVSGIIEIPGSGMAVVVKHGGYRTVYSNLKEVMVSKGQKVDTKQNVGVLIAKGKSSVAHMEIWQVTSSGMQKLDPGAWLAR